MNKSPIFVLLIAAAAATSMTGQSPSAKEFFQQLTSNKTLPTYEQLLQAVDQISHLNKAEAQDVVASVFAALKTDGETSVQGALGLYTLSLRPDSGDLLKVRLPEIAALLARTDSRLKATATAVFLNMKPQPVSVAIPLLSNFILKSGLPAEKVDAVFALIRMEPTAPEIEPAALYLLNLPLDTRTRCDALHAIGFAGVLSPRVIELVTQQLDHADQGVRIAAIQSIGRLGPLAIAQASNSLLKLAMDETQPPAIQRLSRNVLESRTENCLTLSGNASLSPCPARYAPLSCVPE